ncbi:hypothetical protein GTP55_16260 [Duganella sp. FT109W]|uniref:Uncharacterized protein n=1 Tax=Duganella margarita TaxID=2692170 RepID=A0ABW9WKV7_9BURK|nr:hypothetical protein [Duganella margarita]MYN40922.1 hypothetical protein [Duganella margarita]
MKKTLIALSLLSLAGAAQAGSPTIPAVVQAQLASCDAQIVQRAADGILRSPQTLQEPSLLISAAIDQRYAGHADEAAFLYLAMRLRMARQLLFERDWRPELMALTEQVQAPLIMPLVEADPARARAVVQRVLEWDRATPDPYRDRALAAGGAAAEQIEQADAELAGWPAQLQNQPERVEQARAALVKAEARVADVHQARCNPAAPDSVHLAAARQTIEQMAERTVRNAPVVLKRAVGEIKLAKSYSSRGVWLPVRMTYTVVPVKGKPFYAEVDVVSSITPDRRLGQVKTTLACITEHSASDRPSNFRDVCTDDPAARRR